MQTPDENYRSACEELMAPITAALTKYLPKTPPANMTYEELERWHYANGDTALAQCYASFSDTLATAKADAYEDGYENGKDDGFSDGYSDALNNN